ncbi:MAG: hypothetical protein LBP59_04800 [Planctomycetaceae bacterium]|nr:hypothetical protein [Planctomycetaceae bacterium]
MKTLFQFIDGLSRICCGLIKLTFWSIFTLVMLLLAVGFFFIAASIFSTL